MTIMLGLHLVLVTLHGGSQLVLSKKIISVTLDTIFSVLHGDLFRCLLKP